MVVLVLSHNRYKKRTNIVARVTLQLPCVGLLRVVAAGALLCVVVTKQGLGRSMMGPLLGGKQPFRRSHNGLVVGCEEGGGWNWMGSCVGGTMHHHRAFHVFLCFS